MRTVLFLVTGFCLLAVAFILAKLFVDHYPSAPLTTTIVFVAVWLLITAFNMWVGINKAGYSAGEELPIFLMLFAIPAVVAIVLKWKFL